MKKQIIEKFAEREKFAFHIRRNAIPHQEIDLQEGGIRIINEFPDPEHLLDSALTGLEEVFSWWKISSSGKRPLRIGYAKGFEKEEFECAVSSSAITLLSGDTEGIRRGIYWIADRLINAEGPFLETTTIRRKMRFPLRLSRIFFSPTHRPVPPEGIVTDELMDKTDYFPEPYLNRLAREGINSLWITVVFRELCHSFIQEPDPDSQRRLEKLRKITERCRRYGIKLYLFAIEPEGFIGKPEIVRKHPELMGVDWGFGQHTFCPSSDIAQRHLYEQIRNLFAEVPHLGGLINIPWGEALCSCFFSSNTVTSFSPFPCPRCKALQPWQVLNRVLEPMLKGMKENNPDANLIVWFYVASAVEKVHPWFHDCARYLPKGCILLNNFESGLVIRQQGHRICAGDYWQSQVGPAKRFVEITRMLRKHGGEAAAKLQVANAHELATVPEVFCPVTLFRKIRKLQKLGISTVMYSWYFGCAPGFMNRLALQLESEDLSAVDEDTFLKEQAALMWHEDAETVLKAWKTFSKAYSFYPFSNLIQHFGPFHNGITWPLHTEAVLSGMRETFLPGAISGDAIGEVLQIYTLEEMERQTSKMAHEWNRGVTLLKGLAPKYQDSSTYLKDIRMAEAVGLLFNSGWRIFRFYLLRKRLYTGEYALLGRMKKIILDEIAASRRMIEICKEDILIGYHPEAETHLFNEVLLKKRIAQLESEVNERIPALEKRLAARKLPRYPKGAFASVCRTDGSIHRQKSFQWSVISSEEGITFRFECPPCGDGDRIADNIFICLNDRLATGYPLCYKFVPDSVSESIPIKGCRYFCRSKTENEYYGELFIPNSALPENEPAFHILRRYMEKGKMTLDAWPGCREHQMHGIGFYDSAKMGILKRV